MPADQLTRPLLRPDDDETRVRRGLRALDDIYNPRPAPLVASNKDELYNVVAQTIGDVPLTYLEFGVWQGWSINTMAQKFRHPEARFFGFDSFEGLPERWDPNNDVGQFSTKGETPDTVDNRIRFIKGWFQNTVSDFLASHPFPGNPTLIHYDADLYSSTLYLLTTLCHYYRDYYFIFDEFYPDEVNALREFALAYPIEIGFYASIPHAGERPIQLFGRMRRTEFTLWP